MCGIIGISGKFETSEFQKCINTLNHRGPDDSGIFIDQKNNIGLGHTRLSIIDLSNKAHQPMYSEDKKITLIFNGEIYNFKDLKNELIVKGYKFFSNSDTEVLLRLYQDKGIKFLKELNGIFAFAVYDNIDKSIYIARDSFGVKPLYYFESKDKLAFSSEIKALLPFIKNDNEIDLNSINNYIKYLWCPGTGTPFKNVKKVEPGQLIKIKDGKIVDKAYWFKLPQHNKIQKKNDYKFSVTSIRNLLKNAVERQLVSDAPLGAFLSGGLDSSAIVAMAAQKMPDIQCFTVEPFGGSDNDTTNDLPYAKHVSKALNVDLNIIKVEAADVREDIENMIWQLDEPLADPASLNVLYIAKAAKKMGIKVLLSGTGGDDIFTGYRRHTALYYDKYLNLIPKRIKNILSHLSNHIDKRNTFGRRSSKLLSNISLSGDEKIVSYFEWISDIELRNMFKKEIREVKNIEYKNILFEYLSGIHNSCSSIDKILTLEQRFFLSDHNLLYTDKMSMAAGVEVRVPFLDNDLIKMAASIPDQFKQKKNTGKWILKKAMEGYLPNKVIYRRKSGFGVPLRRWMKHELRDMVSDYLSEVSIKNRGIFDYNSVTKLISDNDNGSKDYSYIIFSLVCLEIWYRKFYDSN